MLLFFECLFSNAAEVIVLSFVAIADIIADFEMPKIRNFRRFAKAVVRAGSEKKVFTVTSQDSTVDVAGVVQSISDIPQGDTDVTRNGDGIQLRSINFRWQWDLSTGSSPFGVGRLIVFQWLEDDTSFTPTVFDVLFNTTVDHLSPYNHDTRYSYRILYDKTTVINARVAVGGVTYATTVRSGSKNVMIRHGLHKIVQFNGSTTTGHNKIYIIVLGYPDEAMAFSMCSRVSFSDA